MFNLISRIGFHENKDLKALYLINGIFIFASSLLGPLYALYVGDIKSGPLAVSFSWAVFILAASLFLAILSAYGDRLKNRELAVCVSFLIRSIAWFGMAFITTFIQLLVVQVVLALGDALGGPTFDALIAEHLDKNKHVHDYADWRILAYLAMGVGTLAGGYLMDIYGFKILFMSMSVLALIPTIVIYFKMVKK